ncbi:hypothetical protein [Natrononativus amylolyticus]|uniref:hypothetical protein n=1 Tax=Natrononativus amylolyticus TaxID=2963434 RepID=UPI0020CC0DF1|nr:hypothetical protein [Natrononativus amylolyticus]
MTERSTADGYRGLPGAFPFAFRRSDSLLFKSYVVLGGFVAALIAIFFTLAFVRIIGVTAETSATLSLSRSFVALLGVLVILPVLAPILFVARRHRRGIGDDARYDRRLAGAGFLFILALYVGFITTVPPEFQSDVDGASAPLVEFLYGLPWAAGVGIMLAAALLIYQVHRLSR